jgi:MFS transporter, DHA1 family, inner membrane transport protein
LPNNWYYKLLILQEFFHNEEIITRIFMSFTQRTLDGTKAISLPGLFSKGHERKILFVLAAINFTHILDVMIMMPLGPQFIKIMDISSSQFNFAVSSYSIMAGVSGFFSAALVDRFDRKQWLTVAYLGFLIGTLSCAFVPNYYLLVAARMLAGIFGGLISVQVLAIAGDIIPFERRGKAMATVMLGFSAASVVGMPMGLWLANHFNWNAPFLAIAAIGTLIMGLIVLWIPTLNKHLNESREKVYPVRMLINFLKEKGSRAALMTSFILVLGHFMIIPSISSVLVFNLGYPESKLFLVYFMGGLVTVASAPLVGYLSDKVGKYKMFLTFGLLSLATSWLITHLQPWPVWAVLASTSLLFLATNGRMIPFQALLSSAVPPHKRGSFLSINSAVTQISSATAANLAGWIIIDGPNHEILHYDIVGWVSIAFIALALWFGSMIKPVS